MPKIGVPLFSHRQVAENGAVAEAVICRHCKELLHLKPWLIVVFDKNEIMMSHWDCEQKAEIEKNTPPAATGVVQ